MSHHLRSIIHAISDWIYECNHLSFFTFYNLIILKKRNDSAAFPDTESQLNIYLYTYILMINIWKVATWNEYDVITIIMFTDKIVLQYLPPILQKCSLQIYFVINLILGYNAVKQNQWMHCLANLYPKEKSL